MKVWGTFFIILFSMNSFAGSDCIQILTAMAQAGNSKSERLMDKLEKEYDQCVIREAEARAVAKAAAERELAEARTIAEKEAARRKILEERADAEHAAAEEEKAQEKIAQIKAEEAEASVATKLANDTEHVDKQGGFGPCKYSLEEYQSFDKVKLMKSKTACTAVVTTNYTAIAGLGIKDMQGVREMTSVQNTTQANINQILKEGQKDKSLTEYQFESNDTIIQKKIDYAKWRRTFAVGAAANMTGFMIAWDSDYKPNLRAEMIKKITDYGKIAYEQIVALQSLAGDQQRNAFDKAHYLDSMKVAENTTAVDCNEYPMHSECMSENLNGSNPITGQSGGYIPPAGTDRGARSISRNNNNGGSDSSFEDGGASGGLANAAKDSSNPEDQIATGGSGPTPGYAQSSGGGVVNAGGAGGGGGSGGGSAAGASKGSQSYKTPSKRGSSVANVYKRGGRGSRRIASRRSKKKGGVGFENPFAKLKKKKSGGLNIKSSKEVKRALANEGVRSNKGYSLFRRVSSAHKKVYRKRNIIIYNHASL